jgi:hypothetical protein
VKHSEAVRIAAFCKDVVTATQNHEDRGGDFASENERHALMLLGMALKGEKIEPLRLVKRQRFHNRERAGSRS